MHRVAMRLSLGIGGQPCDRQGAAVRLVAGGWLGLIRACGARRRVLLQPAVAAALTLLVIPTGAWGAGFRWGSPTLVDAGAPYEHSQFDLDAVSCPSAALCVAIDPGSFVAWQNPGGGQPAWTSTSEPSSPCPSGAGGTSCPLPLTDVSCASVSFCAAVNGNEAFCGSAPCGYVMTSTDPAEGAWTSAALPDVPLSGVSCPSTALCVAVGGDVVVTSSSGWTATPMSSAGTLTAVSCASASLCVAINAVGDVLSSTNPAGGGSSWASESVDPGHQLTGISCPSTSLCVAVDDAGRALVSTNPGAPAGTWTPATVDGAHHLLRISCPSGSLCVALDDAGDVVTSSNPAGGASAWTSAALSARPLSGLSCASSSLCVVVSSRGDVLTSADPAGGAAAWSRSGIDQYNALHAIACPRVSFCVAGDDGGNVLFTHAPRQGPSSWSAGAIDPGHTVTRVLCPTVSLCLATDDAHAVFTSVGPSGGAASWVRTRFDPQPRGSLDLTCTAGKPGGRPVPSSRRAIPCLAFDHGRRVFVAAHPGGGTRAWRRAGSTPRRVHDMSCPSTNLCVGLDPKGRLIWSRHPASRAKSWKESRGPFGGAAPHGEYWSGAVGLTCPSASLCVATDYTDIPTSHVRITTSPTSRNPRWRDIDLVGTQLSLPACSSPSLCVVLGKYSGDSVVSTDPTRRGSWRHTLVDRSSVLTAVSCPSPSLCLATDGLGNVIRGARVGMAKTAS